MTSLNHNCYFIKLVLKKLYGPHTVRKVFKYRDFSSPYFVFGLNTEIRKIQTRKKLRIWTLYAMSILITTPLCYLALRMNFKQISYLATLLIKIANKNHWESLLITNLTSPRILLAIPKRRM